MSRRRHVLILALGFALAVAARAEVGEPFGDPQTGTGRRGPLVAVIGDAPDPFPQIWKRLSNPESGVIPVNTSGSDNGDGVPSIVQNPVTGESIVAWARNSAQGFDVVVSRFTEGAWTDPAVVAGGSGDQADPWLAVSPDGTVHLAYAAAGAEHAVWYRSAPSDLSSWTAPLRVSEPEVAATMPSLVVHDGIVRVVYEAHDVGLGSTPKSIVLSRRDGAGFVREVVAMTANAGSAAPRVNSHSGVLWVDWVDALYPTGAGELAWVRLDGQGLAPPHYVPFAGIFDREFHARPGIRLLVLAP
jgi:hypothetical protein